MDEVATKQTKARARARTIVPFVDEAAAVEAQASAVETATLPPVGEEQGRESALPAPIVSATAPASPVATAPNEGSETMATIENAAARGTEQAQAMLGQANDRIKSAFERTSKVGEEIVDFTRGNVEALVASARVAAKYGEEFGQEAADYGRKSYESAMVMFRSVASAKSPTELFQLQSDFARSAFDQAVAEASKVSERLLKVAGDVAQPLSTRYAVAAEKIKSVTL